MKKILLFGAGRTSIYVIEYLAKVVQKYQWDFTVADISIDFVKEKINNYPYIKALELNIQNFATTEKTIQEFDMVLSLLPARLHDDLAKICLKYSIHLINASYLSPRIQQMDKEVKEKNIIFLNEMGLDPGLDHLSAMKLIDDLRNKGRKILAFRSFTGGLIAPNSDDNPWNYKFTWNPRNVVLAGQGGTAKFVENGKYKYIPPHQLFRRTRPIYFEDLGEFEGYANRDSLKYRKIFGLEDTQTVLRGTIRSKGFCKAWNVLVKLGLTDDSYEIDNLDSMTYASLINAFLPAGKENLEHKIRDYLNIKNEEVLKKIIWLGLLEKEYIPFKKASPAKVLQSILEKKWNLKEEDQDMILMQHEIDYEKNEKNERIISEMYLIGEDKQKTAMAKTVGLPMAIACKLILLDKIKLTGVHIPTKKEFYIPILAELAQQGIFFREKTI